jgi:tRNA(adenine34) deaminase
VVFGAFDPQAGAAGSLLDVFKLSALNHHVDVFGGVLAEECGELLRLFFQRRRA